MFRIRNGRLSSFGLFEGENGDGPDGGSGNEPESGETQIKIGEHEISTVDLSTLITSDAAGNVKVDLGEGKTATLKELREAHRRQPDIQRLLADERKTLETEYASKKAELEAEREKLTDGLGNASKDQATKIADAIRDVVGDGRNKDPFASKESAVAYIRELVETDAGGSLAAIVGEMFDGRKASESALKEKLAGLEKKLADIEAKSKAQQVESFMRAEAKAIQAKYPRYNPKGRDEFSLQVNALLGCKEPDPILDGKVGVDMDPVDVARMVDIHQSKTSRERVRAEDDAKAERDKSAATNVRGTGSQELPDDLQKEMDAASTADEVNAVLRKWRAMRAMRA